MIKVIALISAVLALPVLSYCCQRIVKHFNRKAISDEELLMLTARDLQSWKTNDLIWLAAYADAQSRSDILKAKSKLWTTLSVAAQRVLLARENES